MQDMEGSPVTRGVSGGSSSVPGGAVAWALVLGLAAGCADSARGTRVATVPRPEPIAAATTSANPASADPRQLTIRPIPDVISRPQPFRVPETLLAPIPAGFRTTAPSSASEDPGASTAPAALADAAGLADAAARDAVPAGAAEPASVAEIRDMLRSYLRAFNRHDPAALAAHWSPAGESVDLDTGTVTAGREAVHDVFSALFETDDATEIDIDVQSIRPVRDDVAVVDGVTLLSFAGAPPAGSRFSAVVVRDGGRWMLHSVRETAHSAPAPAGRPLDALEWLVGAWENVGDGVTASTQCTWSAGRGFLVRSHALTAAAPVAAADAPGVPGLLPPGDAGPRELTEIIGWDPDRRAIRSWLFTSGGRFAEGTWTRHGQSWNVRIEGRGRDEGLAGECTITPVGADEITVRCDSDAVADLAPPACDFLRTARFGGPAAP